jgi:hypothetical protein
VWATASLHKRSMISVYLRHIVMTSFATNSAKVYIIASAARPYRQPPAAVRFCILFSIFGYATPVFSSRSSNSSRSGWVGGQIAYVMGVRAEAMNCIQNSGGQPSLVTKNTSLSCWVVRTAVSHRLGMLVGLKARAKLSTTPVTHARMKIACTIA